MSDNARSLTFLDETGDTTIVWDQETDEKMLSIIEQKMAQGFTFYIVKPTVIPLVNRKIKAKNIDQVRKAGSVLIKDENLEKLFLSGEIGTMTAKTGNNITPIRKAANANDVASNHSVAVKVARGG